MATMDIIKLHGAAPANFLDVGGNASEDQVGAGVGGWMGGWAAGRAGGWVGGWMDGWVGGSCGKGRGKRGRSLQLPALLSSARPPSRGRSWLRPRPRPVASA